MRIVPYDEILDPADFLQLMLVGFGWAATPERVEQSRRADARRRDPYGYAAYVGRTLAGFVGTMDIPVRTLDGRVETALGIHHVATRAEFCRQGIAARLFEHAHRVYRERGRRFSFLYTSRSLVAWALYRKLGYVDLPQPPRAELLLPKRKPARRKNRTTIAELKRVEAMFQAAAKGRTGFAARLPGWPRSRIRLWKLKLADFFVDRDGYAFTETDKDGLWVTEFIAADRAAYERILDRIVAQGKRVLVDVTVHDPVLKSLYRERGFRFRAQSYGSLMALPLGPASLRAAFGPRFFYTSVDQF